MHQSSPNPQATDWAIALKALDGFPSQGAEQLMSQQIRHSSSHAPGWLHMALALHAGRSARVYQGEGVAHLIDAMGRVGDYCKEWKQNCGHIFVSWHCNCPADHLKRIGAALLLSLGFSEDIQMPPLPEDENSTNYLQSTKLAHHWLCTAAEQAVSRSDPNAPWSPPVPLAGTSEGRARVLLQAGLKRGALGTLRVRAVHAQGAHLLFAPMPTSICMLLDKEFGDALEKVTVFLRKSLQTQLQRNGTPLIDIALAWDLAPAAGESVGFATLHGDSAGAAFACAALQALVQYAPTALRSSLTQGASLLPQAFISAAIDKNGNLLPVGGVEAKAQGFAALREVLSGRLDPCLRGQAAVQPLYLAKEQVIPLGLPTTIKPEPLVRVADILDHIAQRAEPLSDDQQIFLSMGYADPECLSQALAHQDAATRQQAENLLNRLVDRPLDNPVHSPRQAAIQGVARWARLAGGRLRHQFVPVQVRSGGEHSHTLTPEAKEPKEHLRELTSLLDDAAHRAYVITGLPGAGKTVLLRRNVLERSEEMLRPGPSEESGERRWKEMPVYLALAGFTALNPPAEYGEPGSAGATRWWAEQAREFTRSELTKLGWQPALQDALIKPDAILAHDVRWRFHLDGLNELPLPPTDREQQRRDRARWVVQGFLDAFGHALKPLLSVRSAHFTVPDCLAVDVLQWDDAHIKDYLDKYFGATKANALWAQFANDPAMRELCSRPMHMHMQCELIESGFAPLATDRASLYLAHVWMRLRRGLGLFGARDTRRPLDEALKARDLLSDVDRDLIESATPGTINPDQLRELPLEGILLNGLMAQAEHQYWSDADTDPGKDSQPRCSVAVKVDDIQLKCGDGQLASKDLKARWLKACLALGLLEVDARGTEVKFSHQSWGEFFASLRLLDTPPDRLAKQAQNKDPGAQQKWERATVRPFAHLSKPVSAADERKALHERVNARWIKAIPRLEILLSQNGGEISVNLDTFKADASVDMIDATDETVIQRFGDPNYILAAVFRFDLMKRKCFACLNEWVRSADIPASAGLEIGQPWVRDGASWQMLIKTRLFPCFANQIWDYLRSPSVNEFGLTEEEIQLLHEEVGQMSLPAPGDVQEVFNLALQGLPIKQVRGWFAYWLSSPPHPQAWRVLAPAALQLRHRMEPPRTTYLSKHTAHLRTFSNVAKLGLWYQPDTHLQALRMQLLDASTSTDPYPVKGKGNVLDLLLRLQAGVLLGELGDNIRYERCFESIDGRERIGIRLKAENWARIPGSGPEVIHRIGSERWGDSQPVWEVDAGMLPLELHFAETPVVVMQWQAYVDDLLERGLEAPELWAMAQEKYSNPLQPITTVSWFQAQAFTDWAEPLHQKIFFEDCSDAVGRVTLALPTEVELEAAIRYNPAEPRPVNQAWWPHDSKNYADPDEMPCDLFNFARTRWGAPAPVGIFPSALTPTRIEAMGNIWTWCANQSTQDYMANNAIVANRKVTPKEVNALVRQGQHPLLALRGGSFRSRAANSMAACRSREQPVSGTSRIGMRWTLSFAST